jgi:hypothetical protein
MSLSGYLCRTRHRLMMTGFERGRRIGMKKRWKVGLIAAATTLLATAASAQPCNPVIDGTFCAEAGTRSTASPNPRPTFDTFQTMGNDLSSPGDLPIGTLGAITFRGNGTRCIGLLNRGTCR